ncbi:MAG: translation initiation factor [Verrucomicrobiae bacterium]
MEKKIRIPVSGLQPGMQSPFSGLDISGLPEGPLDPPVGEDPARKLPPGRLVFRKEKARRGGKSVVVVSGFDPSFPLEEIETIARHIRRQCGCGGTVRDREIECQGDDPERFRKIFRDLR